MCVSVAPALRGWDLSVSTSPVLGMETSRCGESSGPWDLALALPLADGGNLSLGFPSCAMGRVVGSDDTCAPCPVLTFHVSATRLVLLFSQEETRQMCVRSGSPRSMPEALWLQPLR